jgi:translocation and assembly module TamA
MCSYCRIINTQIERKDLPVIATKLWLFLLLFCTVYMGSSHALAANVAIKGIKDDLILSNVQAHVDSIEIPQANYQFEQYAQQIINKVAQATQVFGYYHAEVKVKPPIAADASTQWSITVELGQATLLSDVLSLGYFDYKFTQHSIQVFETSHSSVIKLHLQTGERYRFGDLRFPEDQRAEQLVLEALPFAIGDAYEADKLAILSRRLKQTQYFRHALVRPLVAEAQDLNVPIEVILTHKPLDNFDLGAGFSSDIGPRFTAKWQRPWVNNAGHSIGADLFLSNPEQYISVDYRIPLEDPVQNYASFQVGFQSQNDNDTTSDKFSLSATRHWTVVDSDWQRALFLRLEQETFTQGVEEAQTTRLLTPGLTLSRLRSRGGLDISWGDKQSLTTEVAADSLFSDIDMLRITAQSKWVRSWQEHRLLWRFDAGAVITDSFEQVPASLRYFAGGDQSIRGFGYRNLSPSKLNADNERELTGGQYLVVGSAEYSYPIAENWRMAVFIDAGTSTNKVPADIATGVGAGINWLSPVGPIRVYIARGNSDFESQWRLHFSMGPSL